MLINLRIIRESIEINRVDIESRYVDDPEEEILIKITMSDVLNIDNAIYGAEKLMRFLSEGE
jgi:hypothetical protein